MKIRDLLKEIKGVFKPPKKRYYFGKLAYGTPYFYPINFSSTIIEIRKLKLRPKEEYIERTEASPNRPWRDAHNKFSNLPMVQRNKHWIKNILGNYYWIEVGWPIMIHQVQLGWKWKFDFIRFEWSPSFQIYFFKWQFCVIWEAPDGDNDTYYEQILWWLKSAKKDIVEARKTWGWTNYETKESTWKNDYLI